MDRWAGLQGLIAGLIASGFIAGPLFVLAPSLIGGGSPDPEIVTRAFMWPIYGLIGGRAVSREWRLGQVPPVAVGLGIAAVVESIRLAVFYGGFSGFPVLLAIGWALGLMVRPLGSGPDTHIGSAAAH
jgi:hypothetical protein